MIALIPYIGTNVTDDALKNFWGKIVQDGIDKIVFYEGSVTNEKQFIDFCKNTNNLIVFVLYNEQLAGMAWLNGVSNGYAFAHFLFFKEAHGEVAREAGQRILDYWLSFGEMTPIFHTFLGLIPAFNRKAIKFSEGQGFKVVGEIPELITSPYRFGRLNATLLYYQR